MEKFENDDAGYLRWLAIHPQGYVINSSRPPIPTYLMLHRSSCWTISDRPANGGSWTIDMFKLCSENKDALERWAVGVVAGQVTPCKICRP